MVLRGCGGIFLKDNKTLLIKRKNSSTYNNLWSNPGGGIEPGETVEQAVIRELEEEVGVTVKIIKHIHNYEEIENNKVTIISSGFLVEIEKGELEIKEPHKIDDMKWFPINELPKNLAPYTKKYIELL